MRSRLLLLLLAVSSMREASAVQNGHHPPLKPQRRESRPPMRAQTIRTTVLTTLAIQNACQMLSMRYSRLPSQPKYLSSTAVVSAEVVKIVLSFAVLCSQVGPSAVGNVWEAVFVRWQDTLKVGVPAFLYLVQNNLLYVATSHLDAATCQVAYQLKLLTTAFFSVALLQRHISPRRWCALGILFLGVVLVQAPSSSKTAAVAHATQVPLLGMAAVSGACLLSGLAGVWLERIVKSTDEVPIWVRNIQLGLVSLVIGLVSVGYFDGVKVAQSGFFQGYTWMTIFVILQVSAGGLLVGLIMKYADNVIKGFATSLSIVLSSVLSWFIPAFDFQPSAMFLGGSTLVICATIMYSSAATTGESKRGPTPSERWLESNRKDAPTTPPAMMGNRHRSRYVDTV